MAGEWSERGETKMSVAKFIEPGVRVGRWTVIHLSDEESPESISTSVSNKSSQKWLCRCDCGTERFVTEQALKYGSSQSCGCLRKERTTNSIAHDLTGQTFGELTVIGRSDHQKKNGGVWWHCKCSCGNTYDVPGTLMVTGRRTHCPDRIHKRNYASVDITGQKFGRLAALYPTDERDGKGFVIWHCRCDCGTELDVSYNILMYTHNQSCGCRKKEHDKELGDSLTHVSGTCVDILKSKKIPTTNTTGIKGVYLIRGKYVAKIVFQQKAYYLGTYVNIDDAAEARRKGEELLHSGTAEYYERWKAIADTDQVWAKENPINIKVERDGYGELKVWFEPEI